MAAGLRAALGYLRTQLADCASWRTACGAANQAEALEHVYYDRLPAPADAETGVMTAAELDALRPFAVISTVPGTFSSDADGAVLAGGQTAYVIAGTIEVVIEQTVGTLDESPATTLETLLDSVIGELWALSGVAGYLAMRAVRIAEGPAESHPDDEATLGRFVQARLQIDYRS